MTPRWRRLTAAFLTAVCLLAFGAAALLQGQDAAPGSPPEIAIAELPAEARATIRLIERGGPYPHERDGTVFHNYEKRLPRHATGYYREYTVRTPGLAHRGARRIVAGRGGELYYTDDHYRSFMRIQEKPPAGER
ncbi:MAG TPA: ribonuclease domain-containing protein [Burkholderiales bacterium]|nr:ribonuclease domain-containing protein [Burkholderiales bacterium]